MNSSSPRTLVTGATGALGQAVLARLLKEPAGSPQPDIIALYRGEPGPAHPRVQWQSVDVTDARAVSGLFEKLRGASQMPQALIHCAGGFRFGTVAETADADWDFLIQTNLVSSFYLARELMRDFQKTGFGRMVFVSSRAAVAPGVGMGPYAASKAALNALVQALAAEAKGKDITANALLPTVIDTPANRKDMPGADTSAWVTTEELAEIAVGLTRPWGRPFQGALIPVSGRL